MIRLIQQGKYELFETARQTKILRLDNKQIFVWILAGKIGQILISSQKIHKSDHVLSVGNYRLYEVENEPEFTDLYHLELFTGDGTWQGYLLPTGLPSKKDKRNRIIPTEEKITVSTH